MTTIDYTTEFAATPVPAEYRDVDYTELNGTDGTSNSTDPIAWDYIRFANER